MKLYLLCLISTLIPLTLWAAELDDAKNDPYSSALFAQFDHELGEKNPDDTVSLSLQWSRYSSLACGMLSQLRHIRCLSLGSFIDHIPADIAELKQLQKLHLSVSHFGALPSTLQHMESVLELHIAHAKYGEVPEFLGEMVHLTNLNFQCSDCTTLTKRHLINLRNLICFTDEKARRYSGPCLKAFIDQLPEQYEPGESDEQSHPPEKMGTALKIRAMKLHGTLNSDCFVVPAAVYAFTGLRELTVGIFVARMATGIANLSKLATFEVSTSHGDNLPSDLCEAISLVEIGIFHVKKGHVISKLPPHVTELNLNCTTIEEEDFAKLPSLIHLHKIANLKNSYGFSICGSDTKLSKQFKKIKARYAHSDAETIDALICATLRNAHALLLEKQEAIAEGQANPYLRKAYEKCLHQLGSVLGLIDLGKSM